ncbi:MAG: addiction module toxin, RelE/StbE family [Devosia sp.]|uniref:type II toxin-antitoxin system RelE/ParE family toxin n=1 Tax=Devosia sp. TaxID=1871048 RepID=UPI00262BBE4C|nr:type II toxin-antitoxin system RelE/ParE family toxin [Devosia sp.]MDB5538405.1 addiction module toxin, RelE/StbE family [Devosia sp.]
MKLIWADEARTDRRELIGYVETESLLNAIELDDRLDEAAEQLIQFPHSGRPGRVAHTRELVIAHTPYIVVYTVEQQEIVVLRLIHAAQEWPPKH